MTTNVIIYILIGSIILCIAFFAAYFIIMKSTNKDEKKYIKQLKEGTKTNQFSLEVMYLKLYMIYLKIPGIKRYLLKVRRRLEIINIEDEYQTRKQASKSITKSLMLAVPLTILVIIFTSGNGLLMLALILLEVFVLESLIDSSVNKLDNKLLKQQVEFFGEIRHAYHESNMVEEAIYQVSQSNEEEVSRQGEKIYEILISDDPETELEKYYDVAPNSYLKEFAGLSYLTREFGDRKTDTGASLYLRNLNNITQEMQIEILKRDKLDYVFQSLSFISLIPVLLIEPLKSWAISNFQFVSGFYNGKLGTIMQLVLLAVTVICYILIRKVKDTTKNNVAQDQTEHPWQDKVYNIPLFKKVVDAFMPKKKTKEYVKLNDLLKDAASSQKIEWLYVNKLTIAIATFLISILLFIYIHNVSINWIHEEVLLEDGTTSMMMSNSQQKTGRKILEVDNEILDELMEMNHVDKEIIKYKVSRAEYYAGSDEKTIDTATDRVYAKYKALVAASQIQWYEILLGLAFMAVGYMVPNLMLIFQKILRQLEMEDEVMQFQTIILMLMKIERVNVEMILEWMERYANIFKVAISKCVNNYESGAWEALEELRNDVPYPKFVTIVESLQTAVEKIPIKDAFDELESEREYYQEKRKDSNERLISRKGLIGKVIGFAPMIILFVGYLIAPLIVLGLINMGETMSTIQGMI